ncbi:hypothetical protein [Kallotenue papyrolyticum]|uniref:hypothetical protein n=1 Tax=Kallotenue papyrolyticum TaxID=1325125 RepID=UPI00049297BE|nr:hypothetical protein [Kallotenue papyrolyticum]
MRDSRADYRAYWLIWQAIERTRQRRRRLAALLTLGLAVLALLAALWPAPMLALPSVLAAVLLAVLWQRGLLDGDLVALSLAWLYHQPISRVELAIIDACAHRWAYDSPTDRAILRAVSVYRSLNRSRLARAER